MRESRFGKELCEDLEALRSIESDAFDKIASMAAAQLRAGAPSGKAIRNAAGALNLGEEELSLALDALTFAIAESARQQLPESELRSVFKDQLSLPAEAVESLVQLSRAEAPHARAVAADLGHPLPAFRRMEWRLDVQVCRSCALICWSSLTYCCRVPDTFRTCRWAAGACGVKLPRK